MPPRVEVDVTLHSIGEITTGMWCWTCNLPSIIGQHFLVEINGHPQSIRFMSACEECGRRGDR